MSTPKSKAKSKAKSKPNIFERKLQQSKKHDVEFPSDDDWIKEDTGTIWDFDTHPEFVGKYLRSEEKGGTGKNKKTGKKNEAYTVNIFITPDGSEVALPNNFAIKQAIEKHGEAFYKINFTAMKKLQAGRKVRTFEIYTA